MHLVGYLYEDYHDARSLERKVLRTVSKSAISGYLPSLSRREDKPEPCYHRSMFVGFMTNMAILTQGAL
jgi:hypothetical protein